MVEGTIFAWLFGFNLLRVQANIVLAPANMRTVDATDPEPRSRTRRGGSADGSTVGAGRFVSTSTRNGRPTLKDAQRLLRDTDAALQRLPDPTA